MAAADLLFEFPAPAGPNLVFGDASPPARVDVTLAINLPELSVSVSVIPNNAATFTAAFPGLEIALELQYNSKTDRPLVGESLLPWQSAVAGHHSATAPHQVATAAAAAPVSIDWWPAEGVQAPTDFAEQNPLAIRMGTQAAHQVAAAAAAEAISAGHANAARGARAIRTSRFSLAERLLRDAIRVPHQDCLHDRRPALVVMDSAAQRLKPLTLSDFARSGSPVRASRAAWHQIAIMPNGGYRVPVVPPAPDEPCYTPSGHLLFSAQADLSADLLFICERVVTPEPPASSIIIPVRRVYLMVNETSLVRVDGNFPIPATDLSVAFDADSWLATFSASIPEAARDAVMPDPSPVEVVATINGTAFHFLIQKITRNRAFGKRSVSISGSGIACELDSPYAPVTQHLNPGDRTAQQLIADALQFTGYDISWGITDWLVPAGVFSLSGTPAAVAKNVAEATGAVLAASWSQRRFRLLPRYPVKPWEWATATPDYVIPGAVTQTESLEWLEYPSYNAVYVSGVQSGILGHVKVTGTAGDIVAPMVSHPLITHADAARQRGIAILGNTGRKTRMQISLPVLPESGIIDVYKLIEFSDGTNTRRGIVRGNRIQTHRPVVRQTLTIEASA